jgi:hypothetical protein
MMNEALWQLSGIEVAAGIRGKRFSCSEVMESTVERIRALNPKLNASVIDLTDQALAEASAADRTLQKLGEPRPLFGVLVMGFTSLIGAGSFSRIAEATLTRQDPFAPASPDEGMLRLTERATPSRPAPRVGSVWLWSPVLARLRDNQWDNAPSTHCA